jgi:hypothetical protein
MTLVIVGAALDLTGPERQHRLCAIVGRTGSRPPGRNAAGTLFNCLNLIYGRAPGLHV